MSNLLTDDDVANTLQVSTKTISRYCDRGMPHYLLSRQVRRFRLDEVLDWARRNGIEETEKAAV